MVETVDIVALGAQGDGVSASGIFVPGTLPGEVVAIRRLGDRGVVEEIVAPAADRIAPVCPAFGTCGGCSVQHGSATLVAAWKRQLVTEALSRRGLTDVTIRETQSVPTGSRRRVALAGRRLRSGALVGFHGRGSDQIVALEQCAVAVPAIVEARPVLERLVSEGAGRRATLRMTVTAGPAGLDVAVEGGKPVEGALYGELVAIAAVSDLARLSWNGETVVTRRPPVQALGTGAVRVVPPPGGFLQPTEAGERLLGKFVEDGLADAARVADLFCGSGTFALGLARNSQVFAADAEAEAIAALDAAWRDAEGLKQVRSAARDLFHRPVLAREFKGFDGIVFDPPRAGARLQSAEIAGSGVPRVMAVSCNPATFARDARTLVDGGYRLDWVQPVDQFLWSAHVELVAQFSL